MHWFWWVLIAVTVVTLHWFALREREKEEREMLKFINENIKDPKLRAELTIHAICRQ